MKIALKFELALPMGCYDNALQTAVSKKTLLLALVHTFYSLFSTNSVQAIKIGQQLVISSIQTYLDICWSCGCVTCCSLTGVW